VVFVDFDLVVIGLYGFVDFLYGLGGVVVVEVCVLCWDDLGWIVVELGYVDEVCVLCVVVELGVYGFVNGVEVFCGYGDYYWLF